MITLQKKSEFCILRVTSDIHISGKALEITKLIILYIKKKMKFFSCMSERSKLKATLARGCNSFFN